MKVYIAYECYYDYCDIFRQAVKVFADEAKALVWKESIVGSETEWRDYEEMEVE